MPPKIIKKKGARYKMVEAEVKKHTNKSIKKINKQRIQDRIMYEIECKKSEERIDNDTPIVQHTTTRQTWDRYTIEQLVNMYVASLAIGKPFMFLTNPQQPQYNCRCQDKRIETVTLYMMCAHVEKTINYCGCKSLVEALFEMQFLPSSDKTPNAAIHFAMLNYLHVTKMVEQASTNIADITYKDVKPLKKDVLTNVYLLYCRIINHSKDLKNAKK